MIIGLPIPATCVSRGVFFQIPGGELEGRRVQLGQEIGALEVERCGEEGDLQSRGLGQQFLVRGLVELKCLAVFAVRGTEAVFVVVGRVEHLAREQRSIVAFLQFDRRCAALGRRAEDVLGRLQTALVVMSDLGNDVRRAVVVDGAIRDGELPGHRVSFCHVSMIMMAKRDRPTLRQF